MANYPQKATESWQRLNLCPRIYEYGSEFWTLGFYLDNTGLCMMRSIDQGEVLPTNGGVTWAEMDIPGAPRNAWSPASGLVEDLSDFKHDRYGNVVYIACYITEFVPTTKTLQVGSFDLSSGPTGAWGPQGTDNLTNPSITAGSLYVVDVKAIGVDDLVILYQTTDIPAGPGSNICSIYGVRYNAGTWGTPWLVMSGDVLTYTFWNSYGKLAHEQGTDYVHVFWCQDTGPNGVPTNDTDRTIFGATYTISTDTLGSPTAITDYEAPHNTGSGIYPEEISHSCNYSGDTFLQIFWRTAGVRDQQYITGALNSATPTWTTGVLNSFRYEFDCNGTLLLNPSGDLLYVHAIGSDNTVSSPLTNVECQIAYQVWNGSTWSADATMYQYATGYDWTSRSANNLPFPDAKPWAEVTGNNIKAIGASQNNQYNMGACGSALNDNGFVAFARIFWEEFSTPASDTEASYFFRKPSTTPPPSGSFKYAW